MVLSQFLQIEKSKIAYNTNESRAYFPTMDRFKIKLAHIEAITLPEAVITDAGFSAKETREYG